jgi:hypothetical protein
LNRIGEIIDNKLPVSYPSISRYSKISQQVAKLFIDPTHIEKLEIKKDQTINGIGY